MLGYLCRTDKTAAPHADDNQLRLLWLGEFMVLSAAVQHKHGLHERWMEKRNYLENSVCFLYSVVYITKYIVNNYVVCESVLRYAFILFNPFFENSAKCQ